MSRHSSSRRSRHNKSGHRRRNRAIGTGSAHRRISGVRDDDRWPRPAARADELELILDPIINSSGGYRPHPGR